MKAITICLNWKQQQQQPQQQLYLALDIICQKLTWLQM